MSDEPHRDTPDDLPDWAALLGSLFGSDPESVMRAIGAGGLDAEQFAQLAGGMSDPAALHSALEQVLRMLSTAGDGPVNWPLANDLAAKAAVAEGDPSISRREEQEVAEAMAIAELWLDTATDIPAAGGPTHAWSRAQWVAQTMPVWQRLTEPVAASVADALARALSSSEESAAVESQLSGLLEPGAMMRQIGGAIFGMQVGNAVGTLAREVLGSSDIGISLTDGPATALLPTNVAKLAAGFSEPVAELRLFLALRECAQARLFAHAPWLRAHLLGAVESYARGITIDTSRIEEAVHSIDPTDPAALQEALSGGVFDPETTPAQAAALQRLETVLALVEGWIDVVTAQAAEQHLPRASALSEIIRRRRAVGGPAEQTFAALVGLELRPRRLRDASLLWQLIDKERGRAGREALWGHPDLLPTPADLDDPHGFAARSVEADAAHAEVDEAIARFLNEPGHEPGSDAGEAGGGDEADGDAADGSATGGNGGTADDGDD